MPIQDQSSPSASIRATAPSLDAEIEIVMLDKSGDTRHRRVVPLSVLLGGEAAPDDQGWTEEHHGLGKRRARV